MRRAECIKGEVQYLFSPNSLILKQPFPSTVYIQPSMLQGLLDDIYAIIASIQRKSRPSESTLPGTRVDSPPVVESRSTVSAIIVIVISTYLLYLAVDRYRKPRVPGPSGLPLLGNILQVPDNAYFLQYTEWAKKYGTCLAYMCILITECIVTGSFYSLNLIGNRLLVVNDHKSAIDLLGWRTHALARVPYSFSSLIPRTPLSHL